MTLSILKSNMANLTGAETLFAAKSLFQSTEFYVTVGLLVGVLLVGAIILHYVDKWRAKQFRNEDDSPLTLSNYRQLYEQGELSEEEYIKVRDRLAAKMKQTGPNAGRTSLAPAPTESPKDPSSPNFPDPEGS